MAVRCNLDFYEGHIEGRESLYLQWDLRGGDIGFEFMSLPGVALIRTGLQHGDARRAAPSVAAAVQPGEGWEYSIGPDVLARLVEIITGQRYIEAMRQRLFGRWAWLTLDMSCGLNRCRGSWLCMAAILPTPTSQDSGASTNCPGPAPS